MPAEYCVSLHSAVYILFRQTKNTSYLQSKISQNKSSNLREIEQRPIFLTLSPEHAGMLPAVVDSDEYSVLCACW